MILLAYKALKLTIFDQYFEMIWAGNILILTLALVSVTDGSSIALDPFVYTHLFRQVPEFIKEEEGKRK